MTTTSESIESPPEAIRNWRPRHRDLSRRGVCYSGGHHAEH